MLGFRVVFFFFILWVVAVDVWWVSPPLIAP